MHPRSSRSIILAAPLITIVPPKRNLDRLRTRFDKKCTRIRSHPDRILGSQWNYLYIYSLKIYTFLTKFLYLRIRGITFQRDTNIPTSPDTILSLTETCHFLVASFRTYRGVESHGAWIAGRSGRKISPIFSPAIFFPFFSFRRLDASHGWA